MTTEIPPVNEPADSFWELIRPSVQRWVNPHASITRQVERSRAQLLATLSLILLPFLLLGAIASGTYGIFLALGIATAISYVLSRSKYYMVGIYLFTYSFTSIAYFRIYQGSASSIDTAVSSTVHISLVFASALLPQIGFVILAALSTIATFATPTYSHIPFNSVDSVTRTGGVVLTISAILYGVNSFLASLDRARLDELRATNRELEDSKSHLEQRVVDRTSELQKANLQIEHRALRLSAISEISQSVATNVNQNLQELLTSITRSLSDKLGFYHTGIFLLDENREYAVLRATNSVGGKKMLDRRHQLKVGGTGIVAYVAQGGRPRIALDTGADAVFFNNPDLPQTHSEMALPLKVGTQVIGVLDVQSEQPSAFTDEDVNALSTLANQVAIIIQNSQLVGGASFAAGSILTQRSVQLNRRELHKGYSYLPDGSIAAAEQIVSPLADRAIESGETVVLDQNSRSGSPSLAVPVKLRDQVIGIIHIEATDTKRKWTEDEITLIQAVSERAALALENASLFEATERRAAQERVVADVTSRIGESNDMERILQTTIQELGRTLGAARTFIQIGAPTTSEDNGFTPHLTDEEQT